MSTLSEELLYLIIQSLNEEGLEKISHLLEQETGIFFDMEYFEKTVLQEKWDEAEAYLSGFTKVHDNRFSTKIYFDLRKQKFLEALDNNEREKALNMLMTELKTFEAGDKELYEEMSVLLTADNIRNHKALSTFGEKNCARKIMMDNLKKVIEANPLIGEKLKFPNIREQRLRRLVNQSLNWQHMLCENPQSNPQIQTLFEDHVCQLSQIPEPADELGENSQTATVMQNPAFDEELPVAFNRACSLLDLANQGAVEDILVGSPTILPPESPCGTLNEVGKDYNLPTTVAWILDVGSSPTSVEFHPVLQTLLLVGISNGDVELWEVNSGEKLFSRNFNVWDVQACSMKFKTALVKDHNVSINRVIWSPDASFFAVAFSKHIFQIYSYHSGNIVHQHLEIDAHVGGVNDLAFSSPKNRLLVISCGDDMAVKAWDVASGSMVYSFEGHKAPVFSLCPHIKENIYFFFSNTVEGKIKICLYDHFEVRDDYDGPAHGPSRFIYSADNTRLFSCGGGKNGKYFLVEYYEDEGDIIREYQGLCEGSLSPKQFDTTQNRFLAVGDDNVVKIWEMDSVELKTIIDAGGDLPVNPLVRFNKVGTLLAVSAKENLIKILATEDYLQSVHKSERSVCLSTVLSDSPNKPEDNRNTSATSSEVSSGGSSQAVSSSGMSSNPTFISAAKMCDKPNYTVFQIEKPLFQSLQLSAQEKSNTVLNPISRLLYTNNGNGILALESSGVHRFWKWAQKSIDPTGDVATVDVPPMLWQPKSCLQPMTNELTGVNLEKSWPCLAVSKNDSYFISTSGGKISLFNLMTFKTMTTFMPPSPTATSLAFHPKDNNIIAIGMDDATIIIYNVRLSKITRKLESHTARVAGLAFSAALNILVSCGDDSQIVVWNAESWQKENHRFIIQLPHGIMPRNNQVQFNHDQTRFLVVGKDSFSVYEASNLKCAYECFSSICQATFSSDGRMVYAICMNGTISIYNTINPLIRSKIMPSAYLSPNASLNHVYSNCIAANPQIPTQFAVGLTDGEVHVFEPKHGSWPGTDGEPLECSGSREATRQDMFWMSIPPP